MGTAADQASRASPKSARGARHWLAAPCSALAFLAGLASLFVTGIYLWLATTMSMMGSSTAFQKSPGTVVVLTLAGLAISGGCFRFFRALFDD